MNLYLISQKVSGGCDTYDSAVVAANNPIEASMMHPDDSIKDVRWYTQTWCYPSDVDVKLIGVASVGTPKGVICASFNAG